MVRFQPSPHRVLVQQTDAVLDLRKSVIIAPDQAKDKDCALAGIIMATGKRDPDAVPFEMEVGDAVLFHVHEAISIKIDGSDYYILSMESVLGRVPVND